MRGRSGERVDASERMRWLLLVPPKALTLATLLCLALALLASAAHAAPYVYDSAASEELKTTVPGESFGEPFGLAFDASGNLFLADTQGEGGESVIDKFDSENAYQARLGVEALKLTGQYARGVAVNDETGHLYVGNINANELLNSEVLVLNSAGEKLSSWKGANSPAKTFGEGCCFVYTAVDNAPLSPSKGEVYVMTSQEGGKVYVFKPESSGEDKEEGEFVRELALPEGFALNRGAAIAIDQSSGEVYLADAGRKVLERYSPEGVFEESAQIEAAAGKPFEQPIAVGVDGESGAAFAIDKRGAGAETVDKFSASGEYLTQFHSKATKQGAGEALLEPVAVGVQRAGAHAGEVYVSDAAAKEVDVFKELSPAAPSIEGVGVSEVSGEAASFVAEIDPEGLPTEFHFEYGRCASAQSCAQSPYEHSLTESSLGSEDFATHKSAPQSVQGLSAQSTYHVRVIAKNPQGQSTSEERIFSTQGPSVKALADDRSWELVSPADKHAGQLFKAGEVGVIEASAAGDGIAYLASAPTEDEPEGYTGTVQVLSRRGAGGWSSRDIASAHAARATGLGASTAPEFRFFAEDLARAIVQPIGVFEAALSKEATEQTPYLRALGGCESGCYRPLVSGANALAGFGEDERCEEIEGRKAEQSGTCGPQFQDASPEARHAVLRATRPLAAGLPSEELYEWSEEEGQLSLVSVLPGEEPAPTGAGEKPLLGSGFGAGGGKAAAQGAISEDGSRVFFEFEGKLYVRETKLGKTLQLDAAAGGCGSCEEGRGRFQLASADGSRVYFTDERRLTGDSAAGLGEPDLYECQITAGAGGLSCALSDLTPSEEGKGGNVQGDLLGGASDGSAVYFVADGAIAGSGAVRGSCVNNGETGPQPAGAKCNLYRLSEGQAKLVAVLSGDDAKDWTQVAEHRPTRVSPNGRWLSFLSEAPLTGYDNREANSGAAVAELYLYGPGGLRCASCVPSGARPTGVEYVQLESGQSEALPASRGEWERGGLVAALPAHTVTHGEAEPAHQPRYLADSGRLFFNALDGLVAADVNGTGDVYEYEPQNVGSCADEGGCVALISSGESPEASAFLDASESGDDVFFLSAQQLSAQDVDSREDVYDAHVCSGAAPCFAPPAPAPAPCSGEGCKAPPGTQSPAFATPVSSTYSGPGNASPPPSVVKAPTRAELLAKALQSCRKSRPHAKKRRQACERKARARYGAKKVAKKTKKKSKKAARGGGR